MDSWRPGLAKAGWGPHLRKELEAFPAAEQKARKAELKKLVVESGPEQGRETFKAMPREGREEWKALYDEICTWQSSFRETGWAREITRVATRADLDELKDMVTKSGPEQGVATFKSFPKDPAKRAEHRAVYREICGWSGGHEQSGWARELARAATRETLDELRAYVEKSGPEQGLATFKSLPTDPVERAERKALYQDICQWNPSHEQSGWARELASAATRETLDELKELVHRCGPQQGLETFKSFPRDPVQRARRREVYEEICRWRSGLDTSGWARELAKPADRSSLPILKDLVDASTPEYGLAAFKALPAERREEGRKLFHDICGWKTDLGRSGWATELLKEVVKSPEAVNYLRHAVPRDGADKSLQAWRQVASIPSELVRELATATGGTARDLKPLGAWFEHQLTAESVRLAQVRNWMAPLSAERALGLLKALQKADQPLRDLERIAPLCVANDLSLEHLLETIRLTEPPPQKALREDEDRWLIGGVPLKKR